MKDSRIIVKEEGATEITREQKLQAIALKYYDGLEWTPKKGDYYTSCRNDLELYRIVGEDEHYFETNYCNPKQTTPNPAQWPKVDFKKGFGEKRIYVPDFILVPAPSAKLEGESKTFTGCTGRIVNSLCNQCFQPSQGSSLYCFRMVEIVPPVTEGREEKTAEQYVGWLKERLPALESPYWDYIKFALQEYANQFKKHGN